MRRWRDRSVGDARGRGVQTLGGGLCQPRSANSNVQYTNYGFVNIGTTTITAECPFSPPFDVAACTPRFSVVSVVVYDRHTSKNVSCALKYIKENGDVLQNLTQTSTGNTTAAQKLLFLFPPPNIDTRSLHMTCNIPPKTDSGFSAITLYSVVC